MNRFDTVSNRFWYDPVRFASFMNANLYAGKDIIQPCDLVPVDRRYDHYTRDVIMKWTTDRETRDLEDPLETISRIKKEDRLIPCITFVIYYGQENGSIIKA